VNIQEHRRGGKRRANIVDTGALQEASEREEWFRKRKKKKKKDSRIRKEKVKMSMSAKVEAVQLKKGQRRKRCVRGKGVVQQMGKGTTMYKINGQCQLQKAGEGTRKRVE